MFPAPAEPEPIGATSAPVENPLTAVAPGAAPPSAAPQKPAPKRTREADDDDIDIRRSPTATTPRHVRESQHAAARWLYFTGNGYIVLAFLFGLREVCVLMVNLRNLSFVLVAAIVFGLAQSLVAIFVGFYLNGESGYVRDGRSNGQVAGSVALLLGIGLLVLAFLGLLAIVTFWSVPLDLRRDRAHSALLIVGTIATIVSALVSFLSLVAGIKTLAMERAKPEA